MKNFYTALVTYFNLETDGAHNSFYNDIGGRLFNSEAPEGTEYPYCIFHHIVDTQIDTFDSYIDNIIIQFSIFSNKSSSVEVHDAMSHLKNLFNDCSLAISGGTMVSFYRTSDGLEREEVITQGEQAIWHFHCDYNAVFERA